MSTTTTAPAAARTGTQHPAARLEDISVVYGATTALRGCTLEVAPGETVALLGPSGSGKSTALKALAGFETPATGRVVLGGRDVTRLSPARRGIGIVVQSYALFPHMSVRKNVAFGLKARRLRGTAARERVNETLRMVGMFDYAERLPRELSGGQQQRVAIARALAIRPHLLLLDEPLSALDASLRQNMIHELQQLRQQLPELAMVYVTHDQGEALALADRIALMRNARLESLGATRDMYAAPPTEFAATFLGGADILPGHVLEAAEAGGLARLRYAETVLTARTHQDLPAGQGLSMAVRPWSWRAVDPEDAPFQTNPVFQTEVVGVQWKGSHHRVKARAVASGQPLHFDVESHGAAPELGQRIGITVDPEQIMLVPAEKSDAA